MEKEMTKEEKQFMIDFERDEMESMGYTEPEKNEHIEYKFGKGN